MVLNLLFQGPSLSFIRTGWTRERQNWQKVLCSHTDTSACGWVLFILKLIYLCFFIIIYQYLEEGSRPPTLTPSPLVAPVVSSSNCSQTVAKNIFMICLCCQIRYESAKHCMQRMWSWYFYLSDQLWHCHAYFIQLYAQTSYDVKTKVTGKSGLTASLFCCLGVEDKNLRVSSREGTYLGYY